MRESEVARRSMTNFWNGEPQWPGRILTEPAAPEAVQ